MAPCLSNRRNFILRKELNENRIKNWIQNLKKLCSIQGDQKIYFFRLTKATSAYFVPIGLILKSLFSTVHAKLRSFSKASCQFLLFLFLSIMYKRRDASTLKVIPPPCFNLFPFRFTVAAHFGTKASGMKTLLRAFSLSTTQPLNRSAVANTKLRLNPKLGAGMESISWSIHRLQRFSIPITQKRESPFL